MIRIGFSTPNWFNPVSWLVRKLTGSRASHTWFVYWDQDFGLDMVMEAHELGFRLVPFERWKRFNTVVAMFAPRRPIDTGVKQLAREQLGAHYDYTGLLGMAVVRLGRWFKRKWVNPFRDAKHVFCSEALALAMRWSGGYEDFKEDPETVDPEALMLYLSADGSERLE